MSELLRRLINFLRFKKWAEAVATWAMASVIAGTGLLLVANLIRWGMR